MQSRSRIYPIFSIYELLRSVLLLRQGALGTDVLAQPVTWYAGLPLLCLMPFIFLLLAFADEKYESWLPVVSLAKILSAISLAAFTIESYPNAIRFASVGDLTYFSAMITAVIFCIADTAIGIYCFRRNRTLCR